MHTIHSRSPECSSVILPISSSSSSTKFHPKSKSKINFLYYGAATIHQSRASVVWNRPPPEKIIPRRRRSVPSCFLQLPLLPFPLEQVLVPSESKTLHLFEARYLGLLEESFIRKKRLFVHFVLDPVVISSTSEEASFAARYGCLVQIEKVERLDVGALVSIRGIGRVTIVKFEQYEFIVDKRQREQTFRKRNASLLKKLNELKTLCDIDAYAIIYSNGAEPEVSPSPQEACRVVERFENVPTMTQIDNTTYKEEMLMKNISKLKKELEIQKENNLLENLLMKGLADVRNVDDLRSVLNLLDEKLSFVNLVISRRA